jgi:hypothetical protein
MSAPARMFSSRHAKRETSARKNRSRKPLEARRVSEGVTGYDRQRTLAYASGFQGLPLRR